MNLSIIAIAAAILCALSSAGGWMARGVLADRDALRVHNETLKGLADETMRAAVAAADYAKKRDLVAPIVRVVRVKSDPIVKILDSCALPADAGRLLDCAALAADSKAGADDSAYAACAALADRVRQADVGRSVPVDD